MHKPSTAPTEQRREARGKRQVIAFLALAIIFLAAGSPPVRDPKSTFTVVLDAGHGGKDPGNLGTGKHKESEKDIALDVVLEVGKYIQEQFPEVEIIYTREKDIFPGLNDRVEIANKAQADLFISVHCNANDNREAYGAETFVMGLHKSEESLKTAMRENASIFLEEDHEKNYAGFDPKNPDTYIALSLRENIFLDQSLTLAKAVQDQFRTRVGRKDRGVKQAGYYVISFTNMPSVLIELGFLTNATEEEFLHSDEGKTYMASAIFRAFKEYKNKIQGGAVQGKPEPEVIQVKQPETKPAEKPAEATPKEEGIVWREVKSGVKYQVQILTSPKKLEKNAPDFKGLSRTEEYLSNGSYKYLVGCTASYTEAKAMQDVMRKKGFSDAFVVAFENGKRIDLNLARQKTE